MSDLPKSWVQTRLDAVAEWGSGGTPSRKNPEFFSGNIPWIKTGELGDKYIRSSEEFLSEEAINQSSAKIFPEGSVGIAMYGATIGKVSIWGADASTNQACAVAQCIQEVINNEFLYYFLLSEKRGFINAGKGGAQPNISQGILKGWPIALPPLNEQKRIVAKIEELFSELDKGIESLKTAREQLKVYRQAVLKNAFEGKLTAHWREQNKDKLETADQLLERICAEKLSSRDLPSLPDTWRWTKSGNLFNMVTSGSRGWAKYYSESGALFIRIGNLDFDTLNLDLSDLQYVTPPDGAEGKRTKVEEGDFLISITGYLGMFAIAPKLGEAYVNQHIALARPKHGFNKEFVGYYIISKTGGHHHLNALTKGAVKAGLGLDDIKSFPVPICTLEEQEKVVDVVKARLSVIDNLEDTLDAEIQKSEALRQSILKKAFSGKLVAQDPNDEPASVLLERIRAEKEAQETESKKPKAKRNAA